MGGLRNAAPKDVPLASSLGDSFDDPFEPNDFVGDDSSLLSPELSCDGASFDKALLQFYVNHKVKRLKRKLSCAGKRNVRQKRSSDYPTCATFTRYSGKFFSGIVDGLRPRYKDVVRIFGMGCLLNFVKTEVPLRLVKWLASRFDVPSSEFHLNKSFIPLTKYDIQDILDLPTDGEQLMADADSGRDFILSHFNVSSIPPVSFFANKLKDPEVELSDEDVFICFMIVAFATFLCPNSSLSPSPKYLHIFKDCKSVCSYDLSRFVYEWLLNSIKKFKDSTNVVSKRSVTLGGCHYAFAVSYLDHVHFGLHSVPDMKPRVLAWRGNKIKVFSELDKNNSRSYGKRPLKHMSPSAFAKNSARQCSASKAPVPPPDVISFASKVHKLFAASLGSENAQEVIELVQKHNRDKPKIFEEWSESLVLDVLDCLSRCASHPNVAHTAAQEASKYSESNHSISIQSIIPNKVNEKRVVFNVPVGEHQAANEIEATPTFFEHTIPGGMSNPVNISSSPQAAKDQVQESSVDVAAPVVSMPAVVVEEVTTLNSSSPIGVSSVDLKAPSGRTVEYPIRISDSAVSPSDGPHNKCEAVVDPKSCQPPPFAEFKRGFADQTHSVGFNNQYENVGGIFDLDYPSSVNGVSPIVPIRLSKVFQSEVSEDVQCSQYAASKFFNSFESPPNEDCIVMVTDRPSIFPKSVHCPKDATVDLSSPVSGHPNVLKNSTFIYSNEQQPLNDVKNVGKSEFAARCQELTKTNNVVYNNLKNITTHHEKSQVCLSPEVVVLSDKLTETPHRMSASNSIGRAGHTNVPRFVNMHVVQNVEPSGVVVGSSSISQDLHMPRRVLVPGKYKKYPYVPQSNRFAVTQQERRHYNAMLHISKHPDWTKMEAVRYDRAYCSYRSLGSLHPNGHLDNFLVLCVCRYLFNETHPSISKKHFFFSYVGETILSNSNPEFIKNAFDGANRAFPMWRRNLLYFPINRRNHWFSLVVCLKERVFAFLDSFFDELSDFYVDIRDSMVQNFINLWDQFVSPILRKRIDFENFEIVHPAVPKQKNSDDCGVFTVMYMKGWSPRTPIGNQFGSDDMDNIRIKLANELFFSPHNIADKSFVTNFFNTA